MATTSIWRVGGRLGKIIDYAENPEKTTNPSAAHPSVAPDCERDLSDVINYAMQQRKTVKESGDEEQPVMLRFVSGVNCHPDTAGEEMLMVKRRFGKEGGTLAYHGYQSFAPGEATPELAHEIGIKLAQRLWGGPLPGIGSNPSGQGKPPAFPLCCKHRFLCGWHQVPPHETGLQRKDTRALNAHKALCAAPISMGRG